MVGGRSVPGSFWSSTLWQVDLLPSQGVDIELPCIIDRVSIIAHTPQDNYLRVNGDSRLTWCKVRSGTREPLKYCTTWWVRWCDCRRVKQTTGCMEGPPNRPWFLGPRGKVNTTPMLYLESMLIVTGTCEKQ